MAVVNRIIEVAPASTVGVKHLSVRVTIFQ